MRTLCLILILGNVLYFSWSQLIDVHVSDLDRVTTPAATPPPRIVLAREVTTTPEPTVIKNIQPPRVAPLGANAPVPEATAAADSLACTSVGPFAELADAAQAQAALTAAGFAPRQRLEQGELWVGYWVSVQNFESREAAETALKALLDSGITDVYLMPGSDPANVLSLGVFSDYQRAQRRAEDIRALGFEPRIDDRKRAGSVYWIDADLSEPGQKIDTSIFQAGPGKIMRLELRACPTPAGG
jgi:hypothetical protein